MANPKNPDKKLTSMKKSFFKDDQGQLTEQELAKKIATQLYDAIKTITQVFSDIENAIRHDNLDDLTSRISELNTQLINADKKLSGAIDLYNMSKGGTDVVYYYYDLPERLRELHIQSAKVNHLINSSQQLSRYMSPSNSDILQEIINALDPIDKKFSR